MMVIIQCPFCPHIYVWRDRQAGRSEAAGRLRDMLRDGGRLEAARPLPGLARQKDGGEGRGFGMFKGKCLMMACSTPRKTPKPSHHCLAQNNNKMQQNNKHPNKHKVSLRDFPPPPPKQKFPQNVKCQIKHNNNKLKMPKMSHHHPPTTQQTKQNETKINKNAVSSFQCVERKGERGR